MKKTIVIATHKVDGHGDVLMPGAINIKGPVPVTYNFKNQLNDILGYADNVRTEGDLIKADIDIDGALYTTPLYPAIGFQIIKYRTKGDTRILDEIKIHHVGLCNKPNIDPDVKPLNQQ